MSNSFVDLLRPAAYVSSQPVLALGNIRQAGAVLSTGKYSQYGKRMRSKTLPAKFYRRDTATVARELLGCHLVHVVNGQRLSGRIIETEAYLGVTDRACHSFGGRRTERVKSMYLAGGHAYVYFIYGMHFCFNVVTRGHNEPEAVLIRALEPEEGLPEMRRHRRIRNDRDIANGPGKLCRALGIDRSCDGVDLTGGSLFIERGSPHEAESLVISERIGIEYSGEAATWPLRFELKRDRPKRRAART